MAGHLENQVLQWCGVDSTQSNDNLQQENIKCTNDKSGAYFPATTSHYIYPQVGDYAPRLGIQSQWGSTDGTSKSPNKDYVTQFTMSGGPPQHPHGRQAPPNTAWNHLQVPNYYSSRQPQHAHMSSELPLLATHQPTWHTPTTEPSKGLAHSPLFNLQQMLGTERPYPRHSPGVDLTLTRNGSQNGDLPQTPISLSVRDAKQINSLPVGALDTDRAVDRVVERAVEHPVDRPIERPVDRPIERPVERLVDRPVERPVDRPVELPVDRSIERPVERPLERLADRTVDRLVDRVIELTKVTSPGLQDCQPSPKSIRRPNKRVDSILERLNTTSAEKQPLQSVIVTATSSSHDENSNSSQGTAIVSVPTPTPVRDDEVVSPLSNEDSLDSNKSRRKRKPSKTVKVSKEDETPSPEEKLPIAETQTEVADPEKSVELLPAETIETISPETDSEPPQEVQKEESPDRRRSNSEPPASPQSANKTRRKTVSESETIDNIAAMVAATAKEETLPEPAKLQETFEEKADQDIPVAKPTAVIIQDHSSCSRDSLPLPEEVKIIEDKIILENKEQDDDPMEDKQQESQCFVAVEDELEKMFAGIADGEPNLPQMDDPLAIASTSSQNLSENVSSTSNDLSGSSKSSLKRGRPKGSKNGSRRPSESNSTESTPRKKHKTSKKKNHSDDIDKVSATKLGSLKGKKSKNKLLNKNILNVKPDVVKDVYSYDSGSNASSSRSKGPFIQIRGPRDSPISVSIINTPSNEDDPDRPPKQVKNKKFHDDSEYRNKVRSKGLHCSTLSNKYDAQTRDATWICVFCKRGPHATDPLLPGPSPFTLDMPQYSPGDLFGPYVITTDCPEYQRRLDDPYDIQFKSKRSATTLSALSEMPRGKKSKKRQNSDVRDSIDSLEISKDVMLGIAEMSISSYEVWAHEDCVIWCPGVYLVGAKIVGLEGAVWSACSVLCKRCGLRGGTVCCLRRGCPAVMHIGCAKLSNWKLDEDSYKSYCTEHCNP